MVTHCILFLFVASVQQKMQLIDEQFTAMVSAQIPILYSFEPFADDDDPSISQICTEHFSAPKGVDHIMSMKRCTTNLGIPHYH